MLTVKPLLTMIFIQNAKGVMRGENQVFFHLKRQRDDHFLANFYTYLKVYYISHYINPLFSSNLLCIIATLYNKIPIAQFMYHRLLDKGSCLGK